MPSYRARLQIGDLLPGHRPEEVMDLAEAAVQATHVLAAKDIEVVARVPRIVLRFTVPGSNRAGEDAEAADLDEAEDDDLAEEREVLTGVEDDEPGDAERRGGGEESGQQGDPARRHGRGGGHEQTGPDDQRRQVTQHHADDCISMCALHRGNLAPAAIRPRNPSTTTE